jgi:hypothetical protein
MRAAKSTVVSPKLVLRKPVSRFVPIFVILLLALATVAAAATPQFSAQRQVGQNHGDQWEPSVAADGAGRIFVLYPNYGRVDDCKSCHVPTMLLLTSNDNGKTWQPPRVMLGSPTGQFDPQIVVDPVDRHTLYAAWLQNNKRLVVLARSVDSGASWGLTVAAHGEEELDKPALAVHGQNVYVAFNHEEEVWVAASQDGGRSFAPTRVNTESRPGWSLLGGATVDTSGNAYLAWASYSKTAGTPAAVNLYIAKSADAGKTWTPNLLDVSAEAPGCKGEECAEGYLGAQVALTSDLDGTLYALWSAGGKDLDAQRIYFSSSTDGGANWLPRANVSSADAGVEHAFPAVVAANGGDVRIAWMDKRNSPYWNTYYRSSSNGGVTWGDEIRISGYVPGYRYIAQQGFRFPFGDYFGLAIDNRGDTHMVWGEGLNYQSPGSIWHASGR